VSVINLAPSRTASEPHTDAVNPNILQKFQLVLITLIFNYSCSREGQVAGSCEHDNELSGSIKKRGIF
jgi:hypothetical protein